MVDPAVLDASPAAAGEKIGKKRGRKRKRSLLGEKMSKEEMEALASDCRREVDSLFVYVKEFVGGRVGLEEVGDGGALRLSDSVVACLVEESGLPFKKLVQEVYQRVEEEDGVTLASVGSSVLRVGERRMYGVEKKDADVLEDESESCIWCWETRDLKLLPKSQRGVFSARHNCRRRIHERIIALLGMIAALSEQDLHVDNNIKVVWASEKLGKTLNESQLRSLAESLLQKIGIELSQKEAKTKEKELIREWERSKKDAEKKKKIMERELLKEKLQSEKDHKKLQDEAEKEKRREVDLKKLLKKQAEAAEKDQKRREKEEAELKKKLSIQKQASMMERFFKKPKINTVSQESASLSPSSHLPKKTEGTNDAATSLMDFILSRIHESDFSNILKNHLAAWMELSHSIQCNKFQNWGIRRKPKMPQIKEIKLLGSSSESVTVPKVTNPTADCEPKADDAFWDDTSCESTPPHCSVDLRHCRRRKKLLQFDKSHRPAYYGTMSRKSDVVGPRCPLKKDPNLDYDFDSDDEWEEEDPGESLSDCDKDDEDESLIEERINHEDEDASEDGFMVPDGYLSEDEGVQVDSEDASNNSKSTPSDCKQEDKSEEIRDILRNQMSLNNLTERALRRSTPLIILNLMHEKSSSTLANDLSGNSKLEQMCLLALSIQPCYEGASVLPSTDCDNSITKDKNVCNATRQSNSVSAQKMKAAVLEDSDLSKIVHCVKSGVGGMNKIMELLQQNFPTIPKMHLKRKVQEIADFVDNRWQVKKEILSKAGVSPSRVVENGGMKANRVAMFFSKRCMSSSGKTINMDASSPQSEKCKVIKSPVMEKCSVVHIGDDCNLLNADHADSGNRV